MQLRIQFADGREQVIACDAHHTLRFGTRRSADVQLEGGGIFPIHFGVLLHHGAFTVVASEQARKIRVNGTRVHEAVLHIGDRIEVGEIVVIVEDDVPMPEAVRDTSTKPTGRESRSSSRTVWLSRLALGCVVLPLVTLLGVYVGQLPTADELRQTAEDAYREEDYARAVDCYDVYLRGTSRSSESHVARTKRNLAEWLSRRAGEVDSAALVAGMQAASAEWNSDDNVSVADALLQLLPPAVRDLTQQAQVAVSSGQRDAATLALKEAQAGIDLLRKYVAPGRLQTADVAQLQADVLRIQRPLDASVALQNTLTALAEAATTADWNAARRQRETLLNAYPQWNRDGRLRDALQQVSAKLATRVTVLEPSRDDAPPPATGSWKACVQLVGSLAKTSNESPATSDQVDLLPRCLAIPSSGLVIGVDGGTGRLLSRTAIGLAGPATVRELGEADCLLADAINQDVRRVDLATGAVKWRLPLQADALSVARDGKRGVVLSRPDVISLIALEGGAIAWQSRLPQSIDVAPVVDPEMAVCYVVSDESHVYVLSAESGACLSVCAVGHGRGTVWAPPISVGEYLLYVEQLGAELSVVHVLRRGNELQVVQAVEVAGTLSGPVQQSGNVVYLPLERGVVGRLRLDPEEQRKPFAVLDSWNVPTAEGRSPATVQLRCAGERVCVADEGLRIFHAPADGSPPVPTAELEPDFVCWGPLSLRGDCLVAVGAQAESLGPQVRAWDLSKQTALWSVRLGVSEKELVSAAIVDDALHILCGTDSYVVASARLLSAIGPLTCLAPAVSSGTAETGHTPQNSPGTEPFNRIGGQSIQGQDIQGPDIQGRAFEIAPEGLACYGPGRELQWRTSLSSEQVVGICECGDGELAVADTAGHVWRIGLENGEIRQQLMDVGAPLMAGPWWIASRLVVLSRDGCVLVWE